MPKNKIAILDFITQEVHICDYTPIDDDHEDGVSVFERVVEEYELDVTLSNSHFMCGKI